MDESFDNKSNIFHIIKNGQIEEEKIYEEKKINIFKNV